MKQILLKYNYLLLFSALIYINKGLTAQTLLDTYSDGNFTANPVWGGNTTLWSITANSDVAAGATGSNTLRLSNPNSVSATDYLSTQVASWSTSQEWGFWVGRRAQAFTASNQMYIWLYANEATLNNTTVDGYRIAIGDDSGGDEIRLEYIVNGAVSSTVITSSGSVTNGITDIGFLLRVTRSSSGAWALFTSTLPSTNGSGAIATAIPNSTNANVSQGSATHNTLVPATNGYLGVAALHSTGADARATAELDQVYFTTPAITPTLTTPTVTAILNDQATLGATVTANGGSALTERGTVYKTSATVTSADNALAEGQTTVSAFTHVRTGLLAQTQYYYAGYATNANGTSLSSESNFRTLSNPPTVQASSLNAAPASTTQIDLSFTGATFPASGATRAGYVVIYSTGTPTLSSANGQAPAAGTGTIFSTGTIALPTTPSTTINVTGLTHTTSYNFLVVPYTWDGTNASTYHYLTASAPTANASTLAGPVIHVTATPGDFSFGNTAAGSTSALVSYTVSGNNLSADISITAPSGFELSTDPGGTFQSSLSLPQSGGAVNSTTIYAVFKPASANGAASGNIAHSSTGATTQNIAASGNALASEPTTQCSITFGARTTTTMVVNFSGGNGSKRILVVRASGAASYSPSDAASPTGVSNVFSSATDKGSGNKILYGGSANTVTITGLTINTTYHFAVYEYNEGTGTSQNYYTTTPGRGSQATTDDAVYVADNLGTTLIQDFNTLATGTSSVLPTGWFLSESGSNANTDYSAGTGSSTTGDTYSFGSNSDRALGSLLSGSLISTFGTRIINTSGETLNSMLVSYTGEQWRLGSSGRADRLDFEYSTNATSLTTGTWIAVNVLDFSSPVTTGTARALDGNTAANRTEITSVISGISVPNNTSIWFRWVDADATGSDDGLAIDDLSITPFSATSVSGNSSLANGTYNNLNIINSVTLTGDAIINGKINLQAGTSIILNGNKLTANGIVAGTLLVTGDNDAALEIAGTGSLSALSFDQTIPNTSNALDNFTLNRTGASITLSNALRIMPGGTVSITNGTLASGGNLTLCSDSTSTARVAALGATGDITGNVTVQRFLKGGTVEQRGWRTMSSPVSSFTYDQLADDILISGPGGATNGFDIVGNSSSIRYFEESATRGWKSIAATTDALSSGKGMLVFFRGDRSQAASLTNSSVVPNHVVADYTGTINKNSISVPLDYYNSGTDADDGFNLVGNPYPCEISWNSITKTAGVDVNFWVTDPATGNYIAQTGNVHIAAGQGFFVQVNEASQSITFEEDDKTNGSPTAYFKTSAAPFTVKMFADATRYDVAWLGFENNASANYRFKEDARKLNNSVYNLSFVTADGQLVQRNISAISGSVKDTFIINVTSTANASYTLAFEELQSINPSIPVYLVDLWQNTRTNVRTNSRYPFQVSTAIPASSGNRFLLVFESNGNNLPVNMVDFSGKRGKNANHFLLEVAGEKNISGYELLRSVNGHNFKPISSFKATNSSLKQVYKTSDEHPLEQSTFYRVKALNTDGTWLFSKTIVLAPGEDAPDNILVYPNPSAEFISVKADGFSRLNIKNTYGQQILVSENAENVSIRHLEKGVYFLEVVSAQGTSIIKFVKK